MDDLIYNKSISYLEKDTSKHLSTLKYMSLYRDHADIELIEDVPEWAVLVTVPTNILSYDTETYPKAEKAIFINGSSNELKCRLLHTLPNSNYILRLNESLDLSCIESQFEILKGNSFISYSCSTFNNSIKSNISPKAKIPNEAARIIARNGYTKNEIKKYFDNGAFWFGLTLKNEIKSACFIYQNYGDIWEIAGVHTIETDRNHGYARIVVNSALKYLLERNFVPRYETDAHNINSARLAQSLGMKPFLTIEHFLLNAM
ncbi:MAG TPA: GNAT family N-acetyltransferase [Dehalococcoidales bacterium]